MNVENVNKLIEGLRNLPEEFVWDHRDPFTPYNPGASFDKTFLPIGGCALAVAKVIGIIDAPKYSSLQKSLDLSQSLINAFYCQTVRMNEDYSAEATAQILEIIRDELLENPFINEEIILAKCGVRLYYLVCSSTWTESSPTSIDIMSIISVIVLIN